MLLLLRNTAPGQTLAKVAAAILVMCYVDVFADGAGSFRRYRSSLAEPSAAGVARDPTWLGVFTSQPRGRAPVPCTILNPNEGSHVLGA